MVKQKKGGGKGGETKKDGRVVKRKEKEGGGKTKKGEGRVVEQKKDGRVVKQKRMGRW